MPANIWRRIALQPKNVNSEPSEATIDTVNVSEANYL